MLLLKKLFLFSIFFTAFFLNTFEVYAQNVKHHKKLFTLQTEHFEIIYPAQSRSTAYKLAERADAIYDQISTLLGITLKQKVPVTITPNTDEHNGYMNPVPYPHIMLFDTYADIEWTTFSNSLETLFLHELTHAVSSSTRDSLRFGLNKIFGGWVYPAALNAPWFMIEGAAVAFESLDGNGRSNDPLIKQKLRQDIIENKFKSPFATSGVYDLPPGGNVYYNYGGLFSTYIINKYGKELYSELWKKIGGSYHSSFSVYNSGFYHIFKTVYGRNILDEWNDFKDSLTLDDVIENTSGIIYPGAHSLNADASVENHALHTNSIIADVVSAPNGKIYFIDRIKEKIVEYDPSTKKIRNAVSLDNTAYSLDVSKDGKYLLVSSYRRDGANTGQLSRAIAAEYDILHGTKTKHSWERIYNARYFRDGIVGIVSDLHNCKMAIRGINDKDGKSQNILLSGNEELVFSAPAVIDDTFIAFTVSKKGKRELSILNCDTKNIYSIKPLQFENRPQGKTASDTNENIFTYMRTLRFSGGSLIFSYNNNDKMYKPAVIDIKINGQNISASGKIYTAEYCGGIFNPTIANGEIFYKGSFSVWDSFLQYPAIDTNTKSIALTIVPWEDLWVNTALQTDMAVREINPNEKNYFPLKYLNPFKFWLPYPLINPLVNLLYFDNSSDNSNTTSFDKIHFDGAGLFFYASTPTDDNLFFANIAYNGHFNTAFAGITWYNFAFTFPIVFNFYDIIDESKEIVNTDMRVVHADMQFSKRFGLGNERNSLTLGGTFSAYWYFYQQSGEMKKTETAYDWDLQHQYYSPSLNLSLSNIQRFSWQLFGSGLQNQIYAAALIVPDQDARKPRFADVFTASIEEVPFFQNINFLRGISVQNIFYAALDQNGMNIHGSSASFRGTIFSASAAYEYKSYAYFPLTWMIGGEESIKLFSFEIQNNLSHFYFNRFWTTLSYKWVYFGNVDTHNTSSETNDSPFLHSVSAKGGIVISIVPLTVLPLFITFNVQGTVKLSALQSGDTSKYLYMGLSLGIRY
ncbi:MAG: hypothetical protein Ta2B_04700 [Termitinemataceae bacterium]|nr:MAG: hypothetical protein Ta2B_04700 [Termitinemataceae bacterium]